jgi:predicted Zn-ribbon and HTH transcriptional regulator
MDPMESIQKVRKGGRMIKNRIKFKTILIAGILVLMMALAPLFFASDRSRAANIKKEVETMQQDQAMEKRKALLEEATNAIIETKRAIAALDNKKNKEALAALERASGKLTIILGREPELALAPFEVNMVTYDILKDIDAVKALRDEIEDALDDGRVQKARHLIRNLASETVISVTHIPLATYPAAIKAAAKLIDEGKVEEAKIALQTALNTLVVIDSIIPLPVVNAEKLLEEAELLAEKTDRSKKESERLADLLKDARTELTFAQVLGYGTKENFKNLYEQLDQIEEKTKGGKSGTGFFDKIKKYLADTVKSSQKEK